MQMTSHFEHRSLVGQACCLCQTSLCFNNMATDFGLVYRR